MNSRVEKVLSELEAREENATNVSAQPGSCQLEKRFWNVPRSTGEFLNEMVLFLGAEDVLEIGTSNGYSGIWLAEALSHTGGRLYTVESHEERFEMAKNNFKKAGLEDFVVQIKGHAPEILSDNLILPKSFDLIFIDATKMEYLSYLEVVLPVLSSGGFIVADNCLTHYEDLEDFIDEVYELDELKSHLLTFDNGLMLSFKVKH